jgi:hypothetical protein
LLVCHFYAFRISLDREIDEWEAKDKGHNIGPARKGRQKPERQLNFASSAILRFFLHASMLFGCKKDLQVFFFITIHSSNSIGLMRLMTVRCLCYFQTIQFLADFLFKYHALFNIFLGY